MANAADLPCCFRWYIFNLFPPLRSFEATFYNGSPTETQWRMTLELYPHQIDTWPFSFSLCNIKFGERTDVVVVDQMLVRVSVSGIVQENLTRRRFGYAFSANNHYTFEFLGDLLLYDPCFTLYVSFEVQLLFPNQNIAIQRNEPVPRECDLAQLSEDLMDLFVHPVYSNLRLRTRPPNSVAYLVHSYIIHTRWSNFFSVHRVQTNIPRTIVTRISDYVLNRLLCYLYYGGLNTNGPIVTNGRYKTELFQVIDRYAMHHLYKLFAPDDPRQLRWTVSDLTTHIEHLRVDDPPSDHLSFTKILNPNTDHEYIFHIKFVLGEDVPRFYYTLLSSNSLTVYVSLQLEVRSAGGFRRRHTVHGRDYGIGFHNPVASGLRHFEGPVALINGFFQSGPRADEHFIRCTVCASDGTSVMSIVTQGGGESPDVMERRKVLSDHMYELMNACMETDFGLSCPAERPANPLFPNVLFPIHKAIFTTRIPRWRDVLENITEGDDLQHDSATCSMTSTAFYLFAAYIYSGKLLAIPSPLLDEIGDFARRGGVRNLPDFIEARRSIVRYL